MVQLNPIPVDTQVNDRMPDTGRAPELIQAFRMSAKFNQRTGDSPYAQYPNQR